VRALLLAVACFASTGLGVLLTPIPVAGALFAFGAPALALLGVILGGRDVSRARRENKPRDTALIGTVLSALGFFPALLTALTCGVCNALVTAGPMNVQRSVRFGMGPGMRSDGGMPLAPLPMPRARPGAPSTAPPAAGTGAPSTPGALPPPPLPAGPGAPP
jgi:hypothetical protein